MTKKQQIVNLQAATPLPAVPFDKPQLTPPTGRAADNTPLTHTPLQVSSPLPYFPIRYPGQCRVVLVQPGQNARLAAGRVGPAPPPERQPLEFPFLELSPPLMCSQPAAIVRASSPR